MSGWGWGEGLRVDNETMKVETYKRGVRGHAHQESLENLDCLGLRFACFHGGQGEYRVVKRIIKSPLLDFKKYNNYMQ